jgi:hypothetical protein
LRTSWGFFVAAVKDGFVVSLFSAEQVIHNASEFVSCGGDCLGFAELPGDTPKELAEIVFGVMQRVRGHAQRSGNAAPDAATLETKNDSAESKRSPIAVYSCSRNTCP